MVTWSPPLCPAPSTSVVTPVSAVHAVTFGTPHPTESPSSAPPCLTPASHLSAHPAGPAPPPQYLGVSPAFPAPPPPRRSFPPLPSGPLRGGPAVCYPGPWVAPPQCGEIRTTLVWALPPAARMVAATPPCSPAPARFPHMYADGFHENLNLVSSSSLSQAESKPKSTPRPPIHPTLASSPRRSPHAFSSSRTLAQLRAP